MFNDIVLEFFEVYQTILKAIRIFTIDRNVLLESNILILYL